ncbi:MAG: tRNA preQ1(34) S-adenosylmethionine ribosyltransferase-isomerase QueA [Elusimicrobia bacterium]|nr:tRNA preQ1(34) S-adenosylmethionine ribosyltransferase-isomerase QueA [Elusimicrobiota bacterium]
MLGAYDYEFPQRLIADRPAEPRDSSRLLILDRRANRRFHARFADLPAYLRPGDRLILNRTKVWPASLLGRKPTGGKAELLLLRELGPRRWTALSSDLKPGLRVELADGAFADVQGRNDAGEWECLFSPPDVRAWMRRHGRPPLPPYILKRRRQSPDSPDPDWDSERYQTVFAREDGSIAAPTAGLHFTLGLLERLRGAGVRLLEITLHVGHGTFQPITATDIHSHRMKSEWYRIEASVIDEIETCRAQGARVVAVGTTATRALETAAQTGAREGWSDLYICPGHRFRHIDALITNFHLPRSTPLVLASAFAGREAVLDAYREAISKEYRLYSYGDAMLLL